MVFPGVDETLASDFLPSIVLISELFPTFDLPDRATSGRGSRGNCREFPTVNAIFELLTLIFIIIYRFARKEPP